MGARKSDLDTYGHLRPATFSFFPRMSIYVHIGFMEQEAVCIDIQKIMDLGGLNITQVRELTGASRTTITKLRNKEPVRRSRVVQMLHSLFDADECKRARKLIKDELESLGFSDDEIQPINLVLRLESVVSQTDKFVSMGATAPPIQNLDKLKVMSQTLSVNLRALENMQAQNQRIVRAHRSDFNSKVNQKYTVTTGRKG